MFVSVSVFVYVYVYVCVCVRAYVCALLCFASHTESHRYMSGDDQILISALAVILASVGREQGVVPPKVSAGILTGVKVLSVVWVSLYWCETCKDIL